MSDANDDHPGASRRGYEDHDAGRASGRSERSRPRGDFDRSVERLEHAVEDLVGSARSRFADRASQFIDDTTERLERELGRRESRAKRYAMREDFDEALPRRLYLDPRGGRLVGVCAGVARYYAVEPWVVRCIAITGLIFFPTLVFPAYWIAYIVMDKPPSLRDRDGSPRVSRRSRRSRRRERRRMDSSPTPEFGPRHSPRSSLRNVKADLTEVELRLRRMESHVTSGRYELQRELHKIES